MNSQELDLAVKQKIEGIELASLVGLIIFAMLFAGLFLGLVLTRDAQNVWPPPSFALVSWVKPALATFIICLSSMTLYLSQKHSILYTKITILLGVVFLLIQVSYWSELNQLGFNVETGVFASFLHALTWVHAAHILLGLLFLFLYFFKLKQLPAMSFSHRAETVSKLTFYINFWHFLTVVWIVLLLGLFAPLS
jgi:cytochrome c oxidase subunit 3